MTSNKKFIWIKKEKKGIEDEVIRDIRSSFELENDGFWNWQEPVSLIVTITCNMNVVAIEVKPYQSKNILIKLNHI